MSFVIKAGAAGMDPRYWAKGPENTPSHWPQRPDIATRFRSLIQVRKFLDTILDATRHPDLGSLVALTGRERVVLEICAISDDGVLGWLYDQHVVYYD